MFDDQTDQTSPRQDPTAVGQAIAKAMTDALRPLIERLEQVSSQISQSQSVSPNMDRYAQARGTTPQTAMNSLGGVEAVAILRDIKAAMDDLKASVDGVATTLSMGER